jgi:hypothetical protein
LWEFDCSVKKEVDQIQRPKIKLRHCYKERNTAMTNLTGLKLSAVQKPTSISAVQHRRNKLVRRLWEQSELAKAQQTGTQFAPKKFRTVTDLNGERRQVEVNKRIKAWWFTTEAGKVAICVRYGTRVLELAKGKYAVEVAAEKDLPATLDVIKAAVLAGELDTAIEAASTKMRAAFGK